MGKGKKKQKGGSSQLGRALLKDQKKVKMGERKQRKDREALEKLGFETSVATNKSITEHSSTLDEFLMNAVMANRDFATNHYATVLDGEEAYDPMNNQTNFVEDDVVFDFTNLPIPRRPKWSKDDTADDLDMKEKEAFLVWRRRIAKLEETTTDRSVTPFEKNIAYWRQLWRVIERSDVVVQVLDARNPLLFRCPDMEDYVKEVGEYKENVLLINKADFLSEELREAYTEYFNKNGIRFMFFSALKEQEILDATDSDVEIRVEQVSTDASINKDSTSKVLTRQQLLDTLILIGAETATRRGDAPNKGKPVIGMTGYPNVGKSSVINVLFGVTATNHNVKRVSVAPTPGHTKHFQTLHMTEEAVLCDCPGLVFPTFMNTKADLMCNGILPLDNMKGRDWVPALKILCRCIPRKVLEETYSLNLPLPPNQTRANDQVLVETFCTKRGLVGSGPGRLNESMGARILLKDFVKGKLVYACPPPDYKPSDTKAYENSEDVPATEVDDITLQTEALSVANNPEQNASETLPGGEDIDLSLDPEAILYEEEMQLKAAETTKKPSRRLLRHGKKHKKARDKDPYSAVGADFSAKTGGKVGKGKKFTRRAAYGAQS